MSFDFNHTLQLSDAIRDTKTAQYELINRAAKKSGWVRLAAPFVALSTAILALAQIVALVVEPIIKGLANILGAPFSPNCNFKRGIEQISYHFCIGVVVAGFATLVSTVEVAALPIGVSLAPKPYTDIILLISKFRLLKLFL